MSAALAGRHSVLLDRSVALLQSLVIHGLLLAGLLVGLDMTAEPIQPKFPNVIQAVVVDTSAIVQAREEKKAAEQQVLRDAAIERRREAERLAEVKRRQQAAIDARREEQNQQAERQAQERRRPAELEARQKQLQEQRAQVVAEREKQRDLELAQAQRQAEEQRKREELEAQRLQQLVALEDQQRQSSEDMTKLEEWVGLIGALVRQNWRKPPTASSGARCRVLVNQLPGGDVISASVAPGCQVDEVTKRSIVDAVLRSEPLPYKGYERVFRRQLTFEFVVD